MKQLLLLLLFLNCSCTAQSDGITVIDTKNKIYNEAVKSSKSDFWIYDASYQKLSYPNGDVSTGGACTDLVIRVLRRCGLDLQKVIHEDISVNFDIYPNKWGLSKPDKNIDHRRVPNIMTYFKRMGYNKPISNDVKNYEPGDIICWSLNGRLTHIGIYMGNKSIYHNIGPYSKLEEDFLFAYPIIGHYRINNL
jgi:uncharacterized protein YijF (DUF1287 family)